MGNAWSNMMSKTVRLVSLICFLLLLSSIGSCYIGERRWENELQQLDRHMTASGFYISDTSVETNVWQTVGFLLFFASVSVGIAAFLLWRQDKNAGTALVRADATDSKSSDRSSEAPGFRNGIDL